MEKATSGREGSGPQLKWGNTTKKHPNKPYPRRIHGKIVYLPTNLP